MKVNRPGSPPSWIALSGLFAVSAAFGQTVSAPASAADGPAPSEVVTLQAFNVTGDAAHGYVASESVTGTRIASKIADLPFAVDVVTRDFINDFQAFTLNDQLAFVSGFSPSEVTGQFQLRGFQAPTTLVDGFRRIGLIDTVDIERIEVIKGSAASIYGAIQPGGAVNILTRQPTTTQRDELTLGGGSDTFYRASLYSSGPAGTSDKVFYSVDLSDQFNKYAEQFSSQHKAYVAAKLLFKLTADTSLSFSVEHSENYEHPFNQVPTVTEKQTMPWAGNSVTESQYFGMATKGLLDYNYAGPESYIHNRVSSATMSFEHRFNEVWSLKLGVNDFVNPYNDQAVGSGAYYPYGTGNVTIVNGMVAQPFAPVIKDQPQADWKPQRGGGAQVDNLFVFSTGPINNKFLVTTDYYELSQRTLSLVPTLGVGTQATDYYALGSPYDPSGASYYTAASTWSPALGYGWNTTMYGQNPALYNGVTTDSWLASADYGVFASDRASMFKDRLILMVGGRWDYVKNQVNNYNIAASGPTPSIGAPEPAAFQAFDYNTSAYTYQLGASFKLTNTINLYANKSSAFNPQPQIDTNTGRALPNNTSNGYEFGIKASFLENRLNVTADQFLINEFNLAVSETDPVSGVKNTILNGQQQARGYELDYNYQATNDLMLFGDWGYAKARTLNGLALTFLDALPVRRVPRNNVGIGLRYNFSRGPLTGFYLIADAKYYSKSLVNLGSGKSLIPGPAGKTVGATSSMYYDAGTNTTYATGTDPKISNELKITATPFNNLPLPGNGQLPYPNQASGAYINYPMSALGVPLPLANPAVPGVYTGEPEGVYVDDGRQNNFNAPYGVVDVGFGYSWKNFTRDKNTIRFSVKNVANRAYTYGSGVPGAPFQCVGTYSLSF